MTDDPTTDPNAAPPEDAPQLSDDQLEAAAGGTCPEDDPFGGFGGGTGGGGGAGGSW